MSDKDNTISRFTIDRPVYEDDTINKTFNDFQVGSLDVEPAPKEKKLTKFKRVALNKLRKNCQPKSCLLTSFPCVVWLSTYNWKKDLVKDLIAGCTVAVMNIPQGMAYALLANVPPVVGLYMAIFPAFIYVIFGTSRHCAMGSFALVSLMSGKVVHMYSAKHHQPLTLNNTFMASTVTNLPLYNPIEVASAICFLVGLYQLILYLLRLGTFSSFLSDTLVNGLTAGAAVHVFTSQLKDLLGIKIKSFTGYFQLIYTYESIFNNLGTINIAACIVSLITIVILVLNILFLKPWVSKRTTIPVPIELFVLLLGTMAAQFFGISDKYSLTTVGTIAIGLPDFKPPPFSLFRAIAMESFVIAIVAYVISISMALIFAHKLHYEIDPNQELLAQGGGNLFGSFFSCLPICASLSRSVIQETVGGQTQLSSIFCAFILIGVLVSFARIFEPLPRAILASLIVVALRSLLCKVTTIVQVWKLSALDGIVFIVTYLTVVLVEVDIGLLVGVILSNLLIFFQGVRPKAYSMARLPDTEIYIDPERYSKIETISGVCIIHFNGSLNFTNQAYFKEKVYSLVNRNPKKELGKKTFLTPKLPPIDMHIQQVKYIVFDMSAVVYMDPTGANSLLTVADEFFKVSVHTLLAGTLGPVYDVLQKCGTLDSHLFTLFPTIHDAVLFTQSKLLHSPETQKSNSHFMEHSVSLRNSRTSQ